jgi:alpha-L-rhamnosidase
MNRRKSIILISLILWSISMYAQGGRLLAPSKLMVDLMEQADFQSKNGYKFVSVLANLKEKELQSVLIGSNTPSFSWEMNDLNQNSKQVAYQLLLSDNLKSITENKGNIYNTGKKVSAQSSGNVFESGRLKPQTKYYWRVRVWNNYKQVSQYSNAAVFYTDSTLLLHKTPVYPLIKQDQKPITLTKTRGVYQADFGRDAFAQLKLSLFSASDTDSITVRIGEAINIDGSINRKPGGAIRYAQYPIHLKKGTHNYEIKLKIDAINTREFSIKMPDYIGEVTPFRYCEIQGYDHPLKETDLIRVDVHYKFNEELVKFTSSDEVLNSVWELCKYSIKATSFAGIYVDGDRERVPYEADAYINQLSHYAVDKEFSLARKSHEYLINHATWPTEWILQSVLIAWHDYLYTGDLQSAKVHYEDLKAKSLMSLADDNHLISSINGKLSPNIKKAIHFNGPALKDIVDWPHSGILGVDAKEAGETDGFVFTKYNAVVNAFYYKSLAVLAKMAHDLGKPTDAKMYDTEAKEVYDAYQKLFFDASKKVYKDGLGTDHASLHTNMFALTFGLVKKEDKDQVLAFIKSRGMACSVYGSQFLLDAVYDAGAERYGLDLLTSKADRSWYNMIRAGSTITMEAWDNKFKPNQDWNHAWGAAPANIISRKLMGVEPLTPGWGTFLVKPQIADLKAASIDVPTIKGLIKVAYKQNDQSFEVDILIPANTAAHVQLPFKKGKRNTVWLDGKVIKIPQQGQSNLLPNIGSGNHHIKIEYQGQIK